MLLNMKMLCPKQLCQNNILPASRAAKKHEPLSSIGCSWDASASGRSTDLHPDLEHSTSWWWWHQQARTRCRQHLQNLSSEIGFLGYTVYQYTPQLQYSLDQNLFIIYDTYVYIYIPIYYVCYQISENKLTSTSYFRVHRVVVLAHSHRHLRPGSSFHRKRLITRQVTMASLAAGNGSFLSHGGSPSHHGFQYSWWWLGWFGGTPTT